MRRSLLVALVQGGIVLSVWANFSWQRMTLPRAWAQTAPVDPYDLMRGRYVSLGVLAELDDERPAKKEYSWYGKLAVRNGQLHIGGTDGTTAYFAGSRGASGSKVRLAEAVRFYIPENVTDPSRLAAGDELWVELSVPEEGAPRPLQLALKKKDGQWIPLRFSR